MLVAGGATIGLALGAMGAGIAALSANNDFDDAVAESNDMSLPAAERAAARERGLDAADKADRRALIADILGFTALAGAVTTGLLLFLYDDSPDDPNATAWRAAPVGGPGSAGAVVQATF